MRFKIDIVNELARADSGAVDHEIEFWINGFEFLELNIWVDFAAAFDESVCEIVEIDRGVISALGKNNGAGQPGYASADDRHARDHKNDLRAMGRHVI